MAIPALISVVAGAVVGPLFDYLKDKNHTQVSREALEAQVRQALLSSWTEISKSAAEVVKTEIQSEDWLVRRWRPIVVLTAFLSYWFVIFPYPFLLKWGVVPQVSFGEAGLANFWDFVLIAGSGYVGGRSLEKVAAIWKGR